MIGCKLLATLTIVFSRAATGGLGDTGKQIRASIDSSYSGQPLLSQSSNIMQGSVSSETISTTSLNALCDLNTWTFSES
ncbi:hypothetical protein RRG08_042637 [Elysia crispata]|uniref:Uncharacterized protein n=1 Tax=Elysia crispata TaxID=231223 RepID=A0AAE0XRC2_9GAST|nr:hypothetical protein RRG08_042637 [Elysia crispata]